MKVLVPVKRVVDPYVKVRVLPDGSGVDTHNVKMSMNPFDEIALEEAIRWRQQNLLSEIVVVTIAGDVATDILRNALALGADRAILVKSDEKMCSLNVAKVLKQIVSREQPDFVMMGKQSIDGDNNQTPQMLAAILGWPQATYVSKIALEGEALLATREIDAGLEQLRVALPAVVSVDLRLNEPRYATLPNIMKAKQKPLTILPLEELALSLQPHVEVIEVRAPVTERGGVILGSVDELLEKLSQETDLLREHQ